MGERSSVRSGESPLLKLNRTLERGLDPAADTFQMRPNCWTVAEKPVPANCAKEWT